MNGRLIDNVQIAQSVAPVDLSGGANAGDWHSLKNYRRALILFHKAVGTAGDDPTLTLLQATAADGTGSKALNISRLYRKEDGTTINTVAQFSEVTSFDTANAYGAADDATTAEKNLLWAVEVDAADLDVDNGFDFFSISVADTGTNEQLGSALVLLYDARYPNKPSKADSAIA